MDATSIYSCDDHLDLRAVPPELWQSHCRGAWSTGARGW